MAELEFFNDLPLDITVSSQGDISKVINADSIKQSLRMLIDTAKGTRIFLPYYGCRIKAFLFEPFDETTAKRIGEELQHTIKNYERRITLLSVNVQMNFDTTSYEINVIYKISSTNKIDSLNVSLERL